VRSSQKKIGENAALTDFKNKDRFIFKSSDSAPLQLLGVTVGKMFSYHPILLIPASARFRRRPLPFEFIDPGSLPRSTPGASRLYLSPLQNNGIINCTFRKCQRLSPYPRDQTFGIVLVEFLQNLLGKLQSFGGNPAKRHLFIRLQISELILIPIGVVALTFSTSVWI